MTDERLTNHLRIELYKHLFPRVLKEDQENGVESYIHFWDDPLLKWDEGALWDEMGVVPVLKNVFFAIEKEESKDVEFIDKLPDLVDPDKCPADFLNIMARSLGHPLEEGLEEAKKREVIKSVIDLNKIRGRELSWDIFYRMIGWQVKAIPLWKKQIFEANEEYSRERYEVATVEDELLGPSGSKYYVGSFVEKPVRPGSITIKVDGKVFRDDDNSLGENFGGLLAQDGSVGSFNYPKGEYNLTLENTAGTDVLASYDKVTGEFPYRAARADLEFFIFLQEESGTHTFDQAVLDRLLLRAEEVRPIHVLLRLIILVLDAPEQINDFATDGLHCGPRLGRDVRSAEYRFYAADVGLGAQDLDLVVEKNTLVGDDDLNVIMEERVSLCSISDKLIVEFSDATPTQYW